MRPPPTVGDCRADLTDFFAASLPDLAPEIVEAIEALVDAKVREMEPHLVVRDPMRPESWQTVSAKLVALNAEIARLRGWLEHIADNAGERPTALSARAALAGEPAP